MTKWTTAQQQAIDARSQNLLINAGAGAGKTAALIERIFAIVSDMENPVSIDSMLIVTFTRAAASEMKSRLSRRLREEVARLMTGELDSETRKRITHFERQMLLVPRAQVSTIDSFCLRIVRENADRIGLPPDVELMDETEASLLHREKLGEVVDRLLEDDEWREPLGDLLSTEKPSEDFSRLQADLLSIHSFLAALEDPTAWASHVMRSYEELADPNATLARNPIYTLIYNFYVDAFEPLRSACDDFCAVAPIQGSGRTKAVQDYVAFVYSMRAALRRIAKEGSGIKALADLLDGKAPRRPSGKSDEALLLNEMSAPVKNAQDAVKKILANVDGVDSLEELARDATKTLPFVRLLLGPLGVGFLNELLEDHKAMRRLTFAQVSRLAIEILHDADGAPSEVAEDLRKEFEYVLVDEYQDVSGMQARLLRAVSRPDSNANQFVVGDVKQSIYGFRQADPEQFMTLYHHYAKYDAKSPAQAGARIDFRENFRSAPGLISELNSLFGAMFSPEFGGITYDESHQLVAGRDANDFKSDGAPIELHLIDVPDPGTSVPSYEDQTSEQDEGASDEVGEKEVIEAEHVAALIQSMHADGRPWSDFAILLRSARNYAAVVIDALQARGIPYFTQAATGFLQQQEIKDATALLRAVMNPYDDVGLVGALRGPAFGWNEDDIARLRLVEMRAPLFENLKQLAEDESHILHAAAAFAVPALRRWQDASRREGMGRLFTLIYTETAIREKVATLPNGAQRLANLVQLQEYAIQFDSFRRKGIGQFLLYFQDLLERDQDLDTPSVAAEDNNCVQIMTVHKSKGLQFKVVFVPFLAKQMNEMDQRSRIQVNATQQIMAIKALPGAGPEQEVAVPAHKALAHLRKSIGRSEELRLLYVALTRAEERLILSASARESGRPGMFAKEIPALLNNHPANTAQAFIDERYWINWLILAWRDRVSDWVALLDKPGSHNDGGLSIHYNITRNTKTQAASAPHETPTVLPSEYQLMLDRVVSQASPTINKPMFVKATATEAKRAFEESTEEAAVANAGRAKPHWQPKGEHPDWWPSSLLPSELSAKPSGAMRGTMTHRYFALVNLEALKRGATPQSELERMVAERLIAEEEAALIRMEQVDAFFADGIGQRILANHARVRRELPFVARFDAGELFPDASDPKHPLILQGVIDLYFEQETSSGTVGVIVDFKTDRTDDTPERFDELERAYSPQLALYAEGLARSLGRRVEESWLYFLNASQSIRVVEADYPWQSILASAFRPPSLVAEKDGQP